MALMKGLRNTHRQQHRWDSELCIVQAASRAELRARVNELTRFLDSAGDIDLKDLAFTLNSEPALPCRLAIVVSSLVELRARLAEAQQKLEDPECRRLNDPRGTYFFDNPLGSGAKLAVLFPGEGAQYPQMLADVCMHFPEARACFDLMDRAFYDHPRGYLPSELVFPVAKAGDPADGSLWNMDGAVEAVFAANQALFTILKHLGVVPGMLAGHSSGDYSALLAAGCIAPADDDLVQTIRALNAVYEKFAGRNDIPQAALLAVGSVKADLIPRLLNEHAAELAIALDNCPQQIVLCGTEDAIQRAARYLESEGAVTEMLSFGRPYHTPLFASFAAPLADFFDRLALAAPKIDIYSCVTAARYPNDPSLIKKIALDQWTHPVRFRETIEAMYAAGARVFVEAGPRGNLTGFVANILRGRPAAAVALNSMQRTGLAQINHAVGLMAAHGVAISTAYLYARRAPRTVTLRHESAGAPSPRTDLVELSLRLPTLHLTAPYVHSRQATATAPPPTVATASDPRARVLQQYFESMEHFLQVEREVMQAAFAKRQTPATPPLKLPFIDRVVSLEPGSAAEAVCDLNLEEHQYLRDHTLGAGISKFQEDLIGLPVLPLAVSIEMLAEAASLLRPGLVVTGVRNVRAHRWVAMDGESLPLHFKVTTASAPCEVRVEMHARGDNSPLVEATFVFADRYPSVKRAGEFPLRDELPSKWHAGEMYGRTGMFHGPAFQLVQQMDRVGEDGAEATFVGQSYAGWLRSTPAPSFLLDPAVLDAMGQVVGYWVGDRFQTGLSVFPVTLERLELFSHSLSPGVAARCRVRITHLDDGWIRSDIDVIGADGLPIARMRQWEDRRLDLPRRLYDFRIAPQEVLLSDPWPDTIAGRAGSTSSHACRVRLPEALLNAHGAIWLRMLAYMVLGHEERREWQRLCGSSAEKRLEWLTGRIAAKDAVRMLLREQLGLLYPADIEIYQDEDGMPAVRGPWMNSEVAAPHISISHSGAEAIAQKQLALQMEGVG